MAFTLDKGFGRGGYKISKGTVKHLTEKVVHTQAGRKVVHHDASEIDYQAENGVVADEYFGRGSQSQSYKPSFYKSESEDGKGGHQ